MLIFAGFDQQTHTKQGLPVSQVILSSPQPMTWMIMPAPAHFSSTAR